MLYIVGEGNHVYAVLPACVDNLCTQSFLYILADPNKTVSTIKPPLKDTSI
jgi:hypothetical protein